MPRAQFPRQGFLVLPPRDGHRPETHFRRVLHAEMAETAQAEHRDQIAGPRRAVAQGVVGGDAGAHQRCGVHRRKVVRHQRQGDGRSDHVVGITAVEGDAGDLERHLAGEEIAAATGIAIAAMAAMPADAHALARFPLGNARAHGIHRADHFMAGHARILQTGPVTFLDQRIAVTDATGVDLDPHQPGTGLRDFTLHDFKRPAGAADLCCTHLGHGFLRSVTSHVCLEGSPLVLLLERVIAPPQPVAAARSAGKAPTAPRSAGRPPSRCRPRAAIKC